MAQNNGSAAAGTPAPESAESLQAENIRLRHRLSQAQVALKAASRALAEAQLAVARALDTPQR